MADPSELPEPDRVEGAPHPRETVTLVGQGEAEAAFLEAFTSQRLHHAWLITGPRGVGKATLAWRIARFLL
ncbi:MAG TPA: DNA polymerase III subunit delta', partial [Rhodobacterales bacterium]|nr:DNA polymerase III subunit delta' [Rhodobacterales bacterium]